MSQGIFVEHESRNFGFKLDDNKLVWNFSIFERILKEQSNEFFRFYLFFLKTRFHFVGCEAGFINFEIKQVFLCPFN